MMTGKIHEWINVWILGKCLAVWVPQRGCTGSGALKWNKKTTTIYLLLSKRKMLFFLTFLFLTCSKYPFCSFFSQRRFFFFDLTSFPLWLPKTQGSNTSFLNAGGPRQLFLLIGEEPQYWQRAYLPLLPTFIFMTAVKTVVLTHKISSLGIIMPLCECFMNQYEAGLTCLNFPQTFKNTNHKAKRNFMKQSHVGSLQVPWGDPPFTQLLLLFVWGFYETPQ